MLNALSKEYTSVAAIEGSRLPVIKKRKPLTAAATAAAATAALPSAAAVSLRQQPDPLEDRGRPSDRDDDDDDDDDAGVVPTTVLSAADVHEIVVSKSLELMRELENAGCADAGAIAMAVSSHCSCAFKSREVFDMDVAVWSKALIRAPYHEFVRAIVKSFLASIPGDGATEAELERHRDMWCERFARCIQLCAWLDAVPEFAADHIHGVFAVVFESLLQSSATVDIRHMICVLYLVLFAKSNTNAKDATGAFAVSS